MDLINQQVLDVNLQTKRLVLLETWIQIEMQQCFSLLKNKKNHYNFCEGTVSVMNGLIFNNKVKQEIKYNTKVNLNLLI